MLREIGRSWGVLLFFGLVTVAIGLVLTFQPESSAHVFAILLGIWLLILGVFRIILAIAEPRESGARAFGMALIGLLAVLIGLLVLHHSFETDAVLGFIIGLFWVVGGLAELFVGFSHESEGHRAGPVILGLLSTAIGVVCLVYPGLSLTILSVLIGLGLVFYGLIEVVLAFQLRSLAKS